VREAPPAPETKVALVAPSAEPVERAQSAPVDDAVLYAVRPTALRAGTSFLAESVRPVERCEPLQVLRGRDDWLYVRTAASAAPVEGWIYGYMVSKSLSACGAEQRAAVN